MYDDAQQLESTSSELEKLCIACCRSLHHQQGRGLSSREFQYNRLHRLATEPQQCCHWSACRQCRMQLEPAVGPTTCKACPRHSCSFGIQSKLVIPIAANQNRAEADVRPNRAPFTPGVSIVPGRLCTDLVSQPWQVCTKYCAQENLVPQSGANLQTGQQDYLDEQYRHNRISGQLTPSRGTACLMPEKLITRSDCSSMPVLERYRRFEKDQRGFLKLCLDSPKPASGGDQQQVY